MAGTAAAVDIWVLLENRHPWSAKALSDNRLSADLRHWLEHGTRQLAASGTDGKPLAVRPAFVRRASSDDRSTVMLARDGALWRYDAASEAELTDIDLTRPDAAMRRETEPQYFVCTNGRRDLCCARLGLPAYRRLHERVGERAWKITHVGGHRFAPNVLALPQGVLYGRVQPEAVDEFVAAVDAGQLAVQHVRGRNALPAAAQFAETCLPASAHPATLAACDDGEVSFSGADGRRYDLQVARSAAARTMLPSCGAEPEIIRPFERQR